MKTIHCYKCQTYLGDIRDAKLKKDMYHVCGKCVRLEQYARKNTGHGYDFLKGIFKNG